MFCVSRQDVFLIGGNIGLLVCCRALENKCASAGIAMAMQNTSSMAAKSADDMLVPPQPSDEHRRRIARIKRTVRRQTAGAVHDLKVELTTDTLFLRGHCASFYCKQKAQHAAMNHLAGETLINEIQVDLPPR
jgi:osmotically-inducible protein OsmY